MIGQAIKKAETAVRFLICLKAQIDLPHEHAMALLFIVDVLTAILSPIFEQKHSCPMHHVVLPIALIPPPVGPSVRPGALHPITDEGALERAAILPGELAMAMLLPLLVLPLVHCPVFPRLLAQPVVQVVLPLALVFGSIVVRISTRPVH